jgi:hypothetical protein
MSTKLLPPMRLLLVSLALAVVSVPGTPAAAHAQVNYVIMFQEPPGLLKIGQFVSVWVNVRNIGTASSPACHRLRVRTPDVTLFSLLSIEVPFSAHRCQTSGSECSVNNTEAICDLAPVPTGS